MNLYHLRYFVTLAHMEHYTRAADLLAITQPSLSHAISSLEYEYNADGEKTKCKTYGEDGSLEAVYEYSSGVLIRKTSYDKDGQIESTTEYECDGRDIEKARKYDKDGNFISETEYDSDGNVKDSGFGDC